MYANTHLLLGNTIQQEQHIWQHRKWKKCFNTT